MIYLVCNEISQKAITALPMRFQRLIQNYANVSSFFLDDITSVLEVFSDKVYIAYPTKSGLNGVLFMLEHMNFRWTYNFEAKDYPVLRPVKIGNQKVLELRYCHALSHLPKSYLEDRHKAFEKLEES